VTTVAITGVSGLVGQHLVDQLRGTSAVDRIIGLDRRAPTGNADDVEFREVDVRDAAAVAAGLDGAEVVVHLAFQLDPLRDEAAMRAINVDGSRNVFDGAAAVGARKIVYASSAVAYGAHPDNDVPLSEESPLRANPDFPYAEHKREVELLLGDWVTAHPDLTVTILRPAIVVGPGIDNFIVRAMQGPRLLAVAGHRPPYQFVHVDDLTAAIEHAIVHDLPGAYNVGAEGWLSFDELAAVLGRKVFEVPEEVAFSMAERTYALGLGELPPGLVHYQMHPWVVGVDKLVATGWRPRHTNRDAVALIASETGDRLAFGRYVTTRQSVRRAAGLSAGVAGGLLALGWLARRNRDGDG
jgi:nucleoside-diphosphate-sugar epimerase